MVNEVTSNNPVLQMPTPVVPSPVAHQAPVKEAEAVESRRQEQAVNGKEVPPSQVNNQEDTEVNMVEVMHQMQDHVQSIERDLNFRVDEESGRTVITVIDPETEEVVRQIPSEEVLNIMHHLRNGGGLLMEEKV
jgi:flagellar protein FlaG